MINIYKLYLLKKFSKKIFLISAIFFSLVLIINLIEEATFLKNTDVKFFTPILLTILNGPSLLYEMFPFIFLISTQFFFIELFENKEIFTLRQFGLSNVKLLSFLSIISFLFGIFIIIIFYNFSAILKNEYLKVKNKYADDNKYLAVITKNGIWIRDISNKQKNTVIINADQIKDNYLINVSLTEFNEDFTVQKNVIAEKVDISDFNWILINAIITDSENQTVKLEKTFFKSTLNSQKINNLFSDLKSLNYFALQELKSNYESIGYSTNEINIQNHKIYSLPILLMLMTIISMIITINNKFKKNILINIIIGIFFSVIIYYITHFSNLLGENEKLPLILSVWLPVIVIFIICTIGVIKINEK